MVAEYNLLVNSLNTYIRETSNKTVRIWSTFPPNDAYETQVDKSVSVQHWEFFEDNPYFDYIKNGYDVLNSDDTFYVVAKWSGSYPQQLNIAKVFNGNPAGGAFSPNIFDTKNATNNPPRDNPAVLGHIAPIWNDYGANATVYSEAYYSWRNGLPALADKQWGGELLEADYYQIFDTLHAAVPDQNLDRSIPSKGSTIVDYNFSTKSSNKIKDKSGNGYDATTNCVVNKSLKLTSSCTLKTPLGSKGRNYTLSFSIKPTSTSHGPIFTGPDSALWYGNGSSDAVMMVAAGNAFALNYTFPVGKWTDASLIARGNQTLLSVGSPGTEMEFLTIVGVNGASFVWAPIAIEAPLSEVGGKGFEGELGYMRLTK